MDDNEAFIARWRLATIENIAIVAAIAACTGFVAWFGGGAEGLWSLLLIFAMNSPRNPRTTESDCSCDEDEDEDEDEETEPAPLTDIKVYAAHLLRTTPDLTAEEREHLEACAAGQRDNLFFRNSLRKTPEATS